MHIKFKYILGVFIAIIFIAVMAVSLLPQKKFNTFDRIEMSKCLVDLNSDLPRKIGTIGWLNEICIEDSILEYQFSINGDTSIDTIYEKHYDKMREMYLYGLVELNGQKQNGTKLSKYLQAKDIGLRCSLQTPSGRIFQWTFSPLEIGNFMDSCKMNPTDALYTTLDMQVKIMQLSLPAVVDSLGNLRTVSINAAQSSAFDDGDIWTAVRHTNASIELDYIINEKNVSLTTLKNIRGNKTLLDLFTLELSKDPDIKEFMNSLAISHSNLILNYKSKDNKDSISIEVPYSIIRKYSAVPQELLTIN